jgi:hypothetical protein
LPIAFLRDHCRQRLLVTRRRHLLVTGQPAQERINLALTHFERMSDSAQVDEGSAPTHFGFRLASVAIQQADSLSKLIQDFGGLQRRQQLGQKRRPQTGPMMKCDLRHGVRSRLAADWWKPLLARK